jgi:pimeloyl-ACP methyl ester carboxylesterase
LQFLLGAAGAVLAAGGVFTWLQTRRTERRYPPLGDFVDVEGLHLHYVERGPTAPTALNGRPAAAETVPVVVLVHGLRGSSRDFSLTILDRLAERYRVIAIDRPGSGYSDSPRKSPRSLAAAADRCRESRVAAADGACGPGSPVTQARLLHAALLRLGIERPVLVAHSLGAAAAMAYAVDYPRDLAGVVTLSGHTLPYDGTIGGTSQVADIPLIGKLLVYTGVTPLGLIVGPRGLRRTTYPQVPSEEYVRAAVRMAIRPRAFLASADDARECNAGLRLIYRDYGRIPVPVLALAGGADHLISPNESLSLSRLVPYGEYRLLPGAGHMPFLADPDAIAAAIDRVWQASAAAGDLRPSTTPAAVR